MKYTRNSEEIKSTVRINELGSLSSLTDQTAILVYNSTEGTKLLSLADLLVLLDLRYEKSKSYNANEVLEAIDKIFNSNSEYDPNYKNINKKYVDEQMENVKAEHNKELIDVIDNLFNPKK